jgi:hypothetical protein
MNGIYSILKARFLINEDATATKNWRFIVFLIILSIIMIANTQRFEQKVMRIIDLTNEIKKLRSEFVDTRSELMKLKMESTITAEMEPVGIAPATVPPVKIKVDKIKEQKNFIQKLWQ